MKRFALALILVGFSASALEAAERDLTLPELIRTLKEKEQEDGQFRAKLDARGELRAIRLWGVVVDEKILRVLEEAPKVQALSTGCVSGKALAEFGRVLPGLRDLRKLGLTSPAQAWPMEFFRAVGGLPELRQLKLGYVSIPAGGLEPLGRLKHLESLDLNFLRQVALKDLEALQHCPKLVQLNLRGAKVDDGAVPALLGMKSLKWVDISQTQISQEGRARLQAGGVQLVSLTEPVQVPGSPWQPWME